MPEEIVEACEDCGADFGECDCDELDIEPETCGECGEDIDDCDCCPDCGLSICECDEDDE